MHAAMADGQFRERRHRVGDSKIQVAGNDSDVTKVDAALVYYHGNSLKEGVTS